MLFAFLAQGNHSSYFDVLICCSCCVVVEELATRTSRAIAKVTCFDLASVGSVFANVMASAVDMLASVV
jgi:hypothetical protein